MLKYFHIAIIYLIGVALGLIGSFFKIESFPYASECLLMSTALQVFAIATLIFKIIKQKGFKE
jgi:membrane-bound ClpP family serine protease